MKTLAIAMREIRSSFVTPLAYVVMAGFMLLSGFFFFQLLQEYNLNLPIAAMRPDVRPNLNEWVIAPYYRTLEVVLVFLLPILTMRAIAEERQQETFALLATSPVSIAEIVVGKFLGTAVVVLVMVGLAFVFPAVLFFAADPEIAPASVGFIGLLLFSVALTACGIAVSACARSQAVAAIVSLVLFLLFYFLYLLDQPSAWLGQSGIGVLRYLAPRTHTELLYRGVISSANVVYFVSVAVFGLFVAMRALESERWR